MLITKPLDILDREVGGSRDKEAKYILGNVWLFNPIAHKIKKEKEIRKEIPLTPLK